MRLTTESSSARSISAELGVSARVFAVRNTSLEALLFDRNVLGTEYAKLCADASSRMVSHLRDDLVAERASELVILSKGLAYQLSHATYQALGQVLPVNLLATRRRKVSSATDVGIDVVYSRLDAPSETLIVGDTIASGATLKAALATYAGIAPLRRVFLLSYCGSGVGVRQLSQWCEARGIQLTVLLGLAAFGLADNGFDLSFLHPDTVADPQDISRARRQFDGRAVSAVGWDFGSQYMAPQKYKELCWMEAEYWELHGHPALALAELPEESTMSESERATLPSR